MSFYSVVRTEPGHIDNAAGNLRALDLKELEAFHGASASPKTALADCVKHSVFSIAGLAGGDVVCICGVHQPSLSVDMGIAWFLSTKALPRHRRWFLKQSKLYVRRFSEDFPVLGNLVLAEYKDSIRWLEWLGFDIHRDSPAIIGAGNSVFYPAIYKRG